MKSIWKYLFQLLLFISVNQPLYAQEEVKNHKNTYRLELGYNKGRLLPIITGFPESNSAWSIEGKLGIKVNGAKYWHQFFHYPVVSVNFAYTDFGNSKVLGSGCALFPTVGGKKKIIKSLSFYYDFGGGLAYFNKPFSSLENADNIVIGSHLTAIAAASMGFQHNLGKRTFIKLGGAFRHYSNGHIKVPNVGANLMYLTGSIVYKLSANEDVFFHEIKTLDKKFKFMVHGGIGVHEVEGTVVPSGGAKYPVYFSSIGIAKRLSYRSQLRLGIDYNYYTDYHDHILNQQIFYDKVKLRSSKVILFAGHELFFDHISVVVKAGANLYYPFRKKMAENGSLEDRFMDQFISGEFGLNYYLSGSLSENRFNPFIGIGIKSIGGKADYIFTHAGIQF